MVETYVPLIDQLGEIVKKHDAMVGELQQLVTSLKLENATLKKRLSQYEPISEDITGLHKEPAEYVYIVADKKDDGTLDDPVVVPCNRGTSQTAAFTEYKNRILVTPHDPKIVAGGYIYKVRGKAYFSEEFHSEEFGYFTVIAAIDKAVESARTNIEKGISL